MKTAIKNMLHAIIRSRDDFFCAPLGFPTYSEEGERFLLPATCCLCSIYHRAWIAHSFTVHRQRHSERCIWNYREGIQCFRDFYQSQELRSNATEWERERGGDAPEHRSQTAVGKSVKRLYDFYEFSNEKISFVHHVTHTTHTSLSVLIIITRHFFPSSCLLRFVVVILNLRIYVVCIVCVDRFLP